MCQCVCMRVRVLTYRVCSCLRPDVVDPGRLGHRNVVRLLRRVVAGDFGKCAESCALQFETNILVQAPDVLRAREYMTKSHCVVSDPIRPHPITSDHITSHHRVVSHHTAQHYIAAHQILSYRTLSHQMASHSAIASHRFLTSHMHAAFYINLMATRSIRRSRRPSASR